MPGKTRNLWQQLLIPLLCIAPSVAVGLYGIDRPYDAIPDQDMLWASEALRLMRGVAPGQGFLRKSHTFIPMLLAAVATISLSPASKAPQHTTSNSAIRASSKHLSAP